MAAILVVDDERSMREFLAICLRREGHDVSVVASADQAVQAIEGNTFEVIITDLRMPGELDGLGLLKHVRKLERPVDVIMVTAYASADTAIAAIKEGAYDYLTKPFKVDEINAVIGRALEKRALARENAELRDKVAGRYRLASLIGKSPQMQRLFELIAKIHSTRTSVLITGESGTGKELVARALHSEGTRTDQPFVPVNCGAIPDELMESELFGHVKGAFTGAVSEKHGLFLEANGGTLFLDEIGELSTNLQVKLLRALQERRIKPVGGVKELELDVRVLAATNRELEEEVMRGAFRSDLYYRLNVIELRLPPLRERPEDVPLLADHFLGKFAHEQGKHLTSISGKALAQLTAYGFPGNVRELENIIEHAVTMSDGPTLDVDALPNLRKQSAMGQAKATDTDFPPDGIKLDSVLRDYERELVSKALERTGGVRKKAARLLGITFRSLRYRLDKLGLDPQSDDEKTRVD